METELDDTQKIQLIFFWGKMEKIQLHINGKEYNAEFPGKSGTDVLINGKQYKVELLKKYAQNIFSFAVNQKILQVSWDYREYDNNFLIIDGFTHEVEITNETKKLLKKFLLSSKDASDANHVRIKAPMPGMVVKVMVEEEQIVEKGDKIIIIEAMKMENAISAPMKGTIKHIKAKEGIAVEKDTVLMEIFA